MERHIALERLQELVGEDLHKVAIEHKVSVEGESGKINKGWAGQTFERYLGLSLNSSRAPNFGSWELKSVSIKIKKNGDFAFKETMAITMIDAYHVEITPFQNSHLLKKLTKAIIVARIVGDDVHAPTSVHSVTTIDLEGEIYDQVESDYIEVQRCISDSQRGFHCLTGHMGFYIQPRTKGPGHGSSTRAFYARKNFLGEYIKLI